MPDTVRQVNCCETCCSQRLCPSPPRPLPLYSPSCREGSFSETRGSKPLHQHTVYSAQSSLPPWYCYLLPGYSHSCCEDLLRGVTGCCSRVAGEFVLCRRMRTARTIGYTGLSSRGRVLGDKLPLFTELPRRLSPSPVPLHRTGYQRHTPSDRASLQVGSVT